jgi:hypothetical protein
MAICAIYARKSTDQIGVADKQRSVAQSGWLVAVWMAITLAPTVFGQPQVDLRAAQKATLLEAIPGGAPQYFLPQGSPIDVEVFPPLVSRAGMPTGFERSSRQYRRGMTPKERVDLSQQSVREILDLLCMADPRYEWREMAGVIVVRPTEAWDDPMHPLHLPIRFEVTDASMPELVARLAMFVGRYLGPLPKPSPTHRRRFTLREDRASLLEVLNRIVLQDGRLAWQYLDDVANSSRSIQLRAFEGENFRVGVSTR